MGLRGKLGAITGAAGSSLRQRVTVWDDGTPPADVSVQEAIDYAGLIAAPSILDMLPTSDPIVETVAGHIVSLEIEYTPLDVSPLPPVPTPETGSLVRRSNFQAQGKHVYRPIEPFYVVHADEGDVTPEHQGDLWSVNAQGRGFEGFRNLGLRVDPLPEVFSLDYYAPNTVITKAYLDGIAEMCTVGAFNDAEWNGYPQSSLQLVRFSLGERTPDDWEISFGFGYAPPQFELEVGEGFIVTELRGSWIYWTRDREVFDESTNVLQLEPYLLIVQRVWEERNFDLLDLPAM